MNIHTTIKERRVALGYTQEQLASLLNVTAPAVNKWEKGNSYPDITLLPTLARVLEIDLNTLLHFEEHLSDYEIATIMNEISELHMQEGLEVAFTRGKEKIQKHPTNYRFILQLTPLLEGMIELDNNKEQCTHYQDYLVSLYHRCLKSEESTIRDKAKSMLFRYHMNKQEYQQAESIVKQLPDEKEKVDKRRMLVKLYTKQNKFTKASRIAEERLLTLLFEIGEVLSSLGDIAILEKRYEDAKYYANVLQEMTEAFDLWEFNGYPLYLTVYASQKDIPNTIKTFKKMFACLSEPWDTTKSPLYRNIKTNPNPEAASFSPEMRNMMIQSLLEDPDYAFLKDTPEFIVLVKQYLDPNNR